MAQLADRCLENSPVSPSDCLNSSSISRSDISADRNQVRYWKKIIGRVNDREDRHDLRADMGPSVRLPGEETGISPGLLVHEAFELMALRHSSRAQKPHVKARALLPNP